MSKQRFTEYASRIVDEQSFPPRGWDWWQLRYLLASKITILPATLGAIIIFGVAGTIATSKTPISGLFPIILFSVVFLGGLFFLVSPFIYIWRWYQALSWGRLAIAQVVEIAKAPPGSRSSLEALEYGAARGVWEIVMPGRSFTQRFYVDEPWGNSLWLGSTVRILVHPTKPTVWMPIGP